MIKVGLKGVKIDKLKLRLKDRIIYQELGSFSSNVTPQNLFQGSPKSLHVSGDFEDVQKIKRIFFSTHISIKVCFRSMSYKFPGLRTH